MPRLDVRVHPIPQPEHGRLPVSSRSLGRRADGKEPWLSAAGRFTVDAYVMRNGFR